MILDNSSSLFIKSLFIPAMHFLICFYNYFILTLLSNLKFFWRISGNNSATNLSSLENIDMCTSSSNKRIKTLLRCFRFCRLFIFLFVAFGQFPFYVNWNGFLICNRDFRLPQIANCERYKMRFSLETFVQNTAFKWRHWKLAHGNFVNCFKKLIFSTSKLTDLNIRSTWRVQYFVIN